MKNNLFYVKKLFIVSVLTMIAFNSCDFNSPSDKNDEQNPVTGVTIWDSANDIIAAIPDFKVVLTESMVEQDPAASVRVVGDVDTISNLSGEPEVTGKAWHELSRTMNETSMTRNIIGFIKNIADNIKLEFDSNIEVGKLPLPEGDEGFGLNPMDMGAIRIEKTGDDKASVYWTLSLSQIMGTEFYYFAKLDLESVEVPGDISGEENLSAEVWVLRKEGTGDTVLESWGNYNGATDDFSTIFIEEDGSEKWVRKSTGDAIVYAETNTEHTGVIDGIWAAETGACVLSSSEYGTADIEIYDSQMRLLKRSVGSSDFTSLSSRLSTNDTNNVFQTYNLATTGGLTNPPVMIDLIDASSNGIWVVMIDNTLVSLPGWEITMDRFIWNPAEGWQSGDIEYGITGHVVDVDSITISHMVKEKIPEAFELFGNSFYFSENFFPLMALENGSTAYKLQRKQTGEVSTYAISWEDEDETHSVEYNWTPFSWWLESLTDTGSDSDLDLFDITLNKIVKKRYYKWNETFKQTLGFDVLVYESSLNVPSIISYNSDAEDIVNYVEGNLTTARDTITTYLDELSIPDEGTPLESVFPGMAP